MSAGCCSAAPMREALPRGRSSEAPTKGPSVFEPPDRSSSLSPPQASSELPKLHPISLTPSRHLFSLPFPHLPAPDSPASSRLPRLCSPRRASSAVPSPRMKPELSLSSWMDPAAPEAPGLLSQLRPCSRLPNQSSGASRVQAPAPSSTASRHLVRTHALAPTSSATALCSRVSPTTPVLCATVASPLPSADSIPAQGPGLSSQLLQFARPGASPPHSHSLLLVFSWEGLNFECPTSQQAPDPHLPLATFSLSLLHSISHPSSRCMEGGMNRAYVGEAPSKLPQRLVYWRISWWII